MATKRDNSYTSWQAELDLAKTYQGQFGRLDRWTKIREYYLNRYPAEVVSVNLLFAIGRAMVPQLYFKAPTLLVKPRPTRNVARIQDRRRQARTLQSVDEWLIPHIGFKGQLKLMILDSYRINIGVGKIGYHSIGSEVPAKGEAQDAQTTEQEIAAIKDLFGQQEATSAEEELNELNKTMQHNYHDLIRPDTPWFLRVPPEDLLVPWGARDIYSAPWCAFRVIRPFEDVKADDLYTVGDDITANSAGGRSEIVGVSRAGVVRPLRKRDFLASGASKIEFLEFYEVWDKRSGRVFALCDDQGSSFLRNEKHNLGTRGLPVSILQFNPDGDDFWGASDAEQILTQVVEYNEARTQESIHRRLSNVKMVVDKNKIDEGQRRRMAGPMPGPVVESDGDPNTAVAFVTPPTNRELYNVSETIRDDIREVIGFSRNQVGEFEVSRRTATEANIVQQNLMLRSDERRDQVADCIAEVFQDKIHPIVFVQWTQPRVVEVTGEEDWREYTGPELQGDYDVSVVPDSTLPLNKQAMKQDAQLIFSAMRNDPRVKQDVLYNWFLDQFDGVPIEELLRTEEEMMQQAQQAMATQDAVEAKDFATNVVQMRGRGKKAAGGGGGGNAPV